LASGKSLTAISGSAVAIVVAEFTDTDSFSKIEDFAPGLRNAAGRAKIRLR
jgi:hypothetical protein